MKTKNGVRLVLVCEYCSKVKPWDEHDWSFPEKETEMRIQKKMSIGRAKTIKSVCPNCFDKEKRRRGRCV